MKFTVRYGGMIDVTSMTDDKQVFLRDPELPWRDFITVEMHSFREGEQCALEIARSLRREFNVATSIKAERSTGHDWGYIVDLMGEREWCIHDLGRHLSDNDVHVTNSALAEIMHAVQSTSGDVQAKYRKSAPGDLFPEILWFASPVSEREVFDEVEGDNPNLAPCWCEGGSRYCGC